jgi:energy-coupling factor transporter ATP-binding protein EcfA2
MRFERLTLRNFQSYDQLDHEFEEGLTLIHGPNGAGKSTIARALYTTLYPLSGRDQIGAQGLVDLIQDGADDATSELEFSVGDDRYRIRVDKGYSSAVFDQGTTQLTDISHELFRPGRVTVVPVNHLGNPEDMKTRLVVMALLTYIVGNKLSSDDPDPNVAETSLLLAMDEAHEFLGETPTVQTRSIVQDFRRIAKRGRKYNLGLALVTQDPGDIDDQIRSQLRTQIYLQLEEEVAEGVNLPGRYAPADLATFSQGQGVIRAPNVRPVEIRGLDHPVVWHD